MNKTGADQYFRHLDYATTPQLQGHHEQHEGYAKEGSQKVQTVAFDFDEIDRRLGTAPPELPRDRAFRQAADLLEALAVWLADSATIHAAGLRALALAWALRPGAFDETSAGQLAKSYGCTKQAIGKYLSQIHRLSRGVFTTAHMRKPSHRADRRRIAVAYHRRVGHRIGARRK